MPWKAHRLTDAQGRRALVWWEPSGPVVEAGDAAFRRRIRRSLRRPYETWEHRIGPDGIESDYRVTLGPGDARYPLEVLWHTAQIGLDDVAVEVVQLREPTPEDEAWLAAARERLRQGRLRKAQRSEEFVGRGVARGFTTDAEQAMHE